MNVCHISISYCKRTCIYCVYGGKQPDRQNCIHLLSFNNKKENIWKTTSFKSQWTAKKYSFFTIMVLLSRAFLVICSEHVIGRDRVRT